jgi:hypothetical protein
MHIGWIWIIITMTIVSAVTVCPGADPATRPADPAWRNVRDFGATGDGVADDTAAFQTALDDTAKSGGRVFVPGGRYLITGRLNVPESVTLGGTFEAPARTQYTSGRLEREAGSILLTTAGKNEPDSKPFITLNRSSHLTGLIIFYPEQTTDVIPYPWCIRGIGDNVNVTDMLVINPYQCLDLGTYPSGRHNVNGLYAHALKTGIFIDKCFDVGRVSNAHFWPFWLDDQKIHDWVGANGTAFIIARTDWEYMTNCFAIFYNVGFHFLAKEDGPGNAVLTQCGSDIGPLAVKVDAVQGHAGVSFVNGQIMAGVEVGEQNTGPVKFTACGFWGVQKVTDYHALIRGSGHVTFTACHFTDWAQKNADTPAIIVEQGGVTLNGCEFFGGQDRTHVELRSDVEAAIIVANRFRSPMKLINRSEGDVQIANNVEGRKPSRNRAE